MDKTEALALMRELLHEYRSAVDFPERVFAPTTNQVEQNNLMTHYRARIVKLQMLDHLLKESL